MTPTFAPFIKSNTNIGLGVGSGGDVEVFNKFVRKNKALISILAYNQCVHKACRGQA